MKKAFSLLLAAALALSLCSSLTALADEPIAQRHFEDSIRCNPSSLGTKSTRQPIGYH